ncbi:MAG: sialate O-acetylesterase [Pseudomonadota bacterium]
MKPFYIVAGQSNVWSFRESYPALLENAHGAGNFGLIEVFANGAPLLIDLDHQRNWRDPDDLRADLISNTISKLHNEPDGYIAGVLWIQGEADTYAFSRADRYAEEVKKLFDELTTALTDEFGAGITGIEEAPIIVSELSERAPDAPKRANWDTIIEQQKSLNELDDRFVTLDPDDVAGALGRSASDMFRDGLHYDDRTFSGDLTGAAVDLLQTNAENAPDVLRKNAGDNLFRFEDEEMIFAGRRGDDVYRIDDAEKRIVEMAGHGRDQVVAKIDFDLSDHGGHLEDLQLIGDAAVGVGNQRANEILGSKADNELSGDAGADTIRGGAGDDTLHGGIGRDDLGGGGGDDDVRGGGGGDVLNGGNGIDMIAGGRGDDTLTGGNGADQFVFAWRGGDDVVTDFVRGVDAIALDFDKVAFEDLTFEAREDGLLVEFDGRGTVLLEGVADTALTEDDVFTLGF